VANEERPEQRPDEQREPHQALYRRYRPQTPAELQGQDHVVRALTGAIREDRLHHAFLFCGPRGTGKTSTARILAKMVNCVHAPTAEPCDVCEQCVAIREGTHVDVVEIDAASHGGVDDARDLREKAPTAPMIGREKVYIIDEAQRLSREAFDALLKLFEEPPPGVRFVLATTEPHKMPATIVGRCQRFDFRRLTIEGLADLVGKVAGSEGVSLDPATAHAIARRAEGSARDALSLLDQATVLGGQTVDEETIRALLGAPRGEVQFEIADVVAVGDVRGVFEIVDRLVLDGRDVRDVTNEAIGHVRDLLLVKTAPGQEDLLDIPSDAYDTLRVQAEKFSTGELSRVLMLLQAAQNDMRWTTSPRLSLELALVRSCLPETDPAPEALVSRLERLERLANLTPESQTSVTEEVVVVEEEIAAAFRDVPKSGGGEGVGEPEEVRQGQRDDTRAGSGQMPVPQAADAGSVDVAMLRRSWPALMQHLGESGKQVVRASLESATVASFDGETLELAFPPDRKFAVQKIESREDVLRQALTDLFGISPRISCVVRGSREPGATSTVEVVEEDDAPDEAEALRRVQEMLGATPIEGGE
jgi:DNA polymerase III subunit gamma/tau